MGTIQPDKAATINDDLVRIIEEAHAYTNKLSTHKSISDKRMELMSELDVVNKKINKLGQTRNNPTVPTVPPKAFLEAIISDTNFFDHQHNNGNSNIPTGNFISDINFLDH